MPLLPLLRGRKRARIAVITSAVAALLLGGTITAVAASTGSTAAPSAQRNTHTTDTTDPYIFVHDPSMAEEDGTYYVFSTGDPAGAIGNGNIQIRTSRDLRNWTYQGTVFAAKPTWITSTVGNIPNLWAPDISYFGGLWHLYYAGSSFGSNEPFSTCL
jgi:beta-xylosidase